VQNQYYSISIDHAKPTIETLERGVSIADVGWTVTEPTPVLMGDLFEAAGKSSKVGKQVFNYIASEGVEGVLVLDSRAGTPAERSHFRPG
jgi:hypothetical protein